MLLFSSFRSGQEANKLHHRGDSWLDLGMECVSGAGVGPEAAVRELRAIDWEHRLNEELVAGVAATRASETSRLASSAFGAQGFASAVEHYARRRPQVCHHLRGVSAGPAKRRMHAVGRIRGALGAASEMDDARPCLGPQGRHAAYHREDIEFGSQPACFKVGGRRGCAGEDGALPRQAAKLTLNVLATSSCVRMGR